MNQEEALYLAQTILKVDKLIEEVEKLQKELAELKRQHQGHQHSVFVYPGYRNTSGPVM